MKDNIQPKVSVFIVTYNHEKYIAQAIESVLMQVTTFQIEVVIGEDCSTDGTRAIVQHYAAAHPDKIRPLLHEKNLGGGGCLNGQAVLNACRGKYLALLDGDDYWTDPQKLQKQVEFLENNPECTFCYHNVLFRRESDWGGDLTISTGDLWDVSRQSRATFADLVAGFCPPTAGCVLVNDRDLLRPLLGGQFLCTAGNLYYCLARAGGVGRFIPGVMAEYRLHSGGVWSAFHSETRRMSNIKRLETEQAFFNEPKWSKVFDARFYEEYVLMAAEQVARGRFAAAFKSYATGIRFLRHWPSPAQFKFIISAHSRIVLWPFRRAWRVISKHTQTKTS